jgi:CheY-like chemotaxis protein
VAEGKGLDFNIELGSSLASEIMHTDAKRLQQVLKNLLSNAFKFTQEGEVTLTVRRAEKGRRFQNHTLDSAADVVAFAVQDTGIGIAKDKQRLIFEAFQQADGTTNRKYGGTGLGLSISREIARLLGGEIRVESAEGKGSTFTLFLPTRFAGLPHSDEGGTEPRTIQRRDPSATAMTRSSSAAVSARPNVMRGPRPNQRRKPSGDALQYQPERRAVPQTVIADDRDAIEEGDRTVLIIENDQNFAKVLLDMARDKGYKGVVELDGEAGLKASREVRPDAITLDIDMPGLDGLQVLDRLKRDPETRHVPVHIISGVEQKREGLKAGAIAYLAKPVSKEGLDAAFARISTFIDTVPKKLIVVEDNEAQRQSIVELIAHEDVEITAVPSAEDALDKISEQHFDCMVLDLGLHTGQMTGFDLLEKVKSDPNNHDLPIIIYTGKELSPKEETEIRKYAETIILKDVKSPERLLDETALFLHRVEAKLPEQKRKMLEHLHDSDSVVSGKSILVVDDDVRNIFSLTSVLEDHGMIVRFAETGKQAIDELKKDPNVDAVLMDVMMPEMDGYETTRAIREMDQFKTLPIIALTAKAMKGDREKCIAAGASDYITKPVDTEQLLSLLRVWLYR